APCSARTTSSAPNVGLNAVASMSAEAARSETVIIALRPSASDNVPAKTSDTARVADVTDSDRLAVAGGTSNSRGNVGRGGWGRRVTRPLTNRALWGRQTAAEPTSMRRTATLVDTPPGQT